MKKRIHKKRIYIITITIASMAFGAAYGMPRLQDSQAKLIESIQALPSDSTKRSKLLETLHSLVESELKQRFEKQEAELKQIEQRLEEAKSKLDLRKSKQTEIVDRRIVDLLQKRDDLDWASSTASQDNVIVSPELQAPNRQRTNKSIIGGQEDPIAFLNQLESQVVRNGTPPSNSTIKTTDAVLTPTTETDSVASTGKESSFVTSAESSQIIALMNESLEVEVTIEVFLNDGMVGWSHPSKKEEAKSLWKRIRLLELKLEVLQMNKESIIGRLGAELSLRNSMLEVAEQDLEISKELFRKGAEGFMDNQKKMLEERVAKTRATQITVELESFRRQMVDLANRVQIVRKKYDEIVAKIDKSAKTIPEVK